MENRRLAAVLIEGKALKPTRKIPNIGSNQPQIFNSFCKNAAGIIVAPICQPGHLNSGFRVPVVGYPSQEPGTWNLNFLHTPYNFTTAVTIKERPSEGQMPGPGWIVGLLVKYWVLVKLFKLALSERFLLKR